MNVDLRLGDCLEIMKDIPDGSVDMVLCDLPYGTTHNKWDSVIPFGELWVQYNRVAKENAAFVLFAQGLFYVDLVQSNRKNFRYDIVWDKMLKTSFLNANVTPMRRHEQIAVFYRRKPVYNPQFEEGEPLHSIGNRTKIKTNNNYGDYGNWGDHRKGSTEKYPSSLVAFRKPHPSKALHPTEKPVALLEWLVKTYSDEGDTVLDNCMGSGSAGVACVNTGRNFIGIEMDEKYFGIAGERIREAESAVRNRLF